ncbi:hypothetical protein CLM62_25250 [Streptomyces sp. SA15]|nr:hypothetical protein CLM62_25250 [Streptomyces sp. SA15]
MAVCAVLLSSCASTAGQSETRAPADRQFDLLVSRHNGYHYPPFLRNQPAPPEAQSYALRTLSELGRGIRTSMSAARVASMRGEALAASPLWGRTWLIPLRRAGAAEALGASDVAAVEKLRTEGGWYVDPALGDDGDAARLGATWAALDVLKALGRPGPSVTADWLSSLAGEPRPLDERAALACALRLLGRPVPATLMDVDAPRTHDWATLTPNGRADRLYDTYSYVLIQEAAGERPDIDRRTWEEVLREGAATLSYEHVYFLVHTLKAAGSPESVFAPVVKRFESERLDDGTVRDPDTYVGNPDASLFVERLRALAGRPVEDPRLVAALDRDEKTGAVGQEAAERLSRAALRRVATDGDVDGQAAHLCSDPAVLATTVTEQNATQWQRTALNCADAGTEIGAPRVRPWALDTPEAVVAAATVAVGMADAGQPGRIPAWITSEALEQWARHPARFVSVYDYALVVRAYSLLGGALDASLREALRHGVAAYRGCPGLPDLYQVGGGDTACDLKTTWGVWTLDRQLRGLMGWMPSRDGRSTYGKRAEVR